MFSKKGLSKYASLCLISSQDYKYSSSDIREFLENKFEVKTETIYPMLRKLYTDDLIEFKFSENDYTPRKEFKITKLGIESIKESKEQLDEVNKITEIAKLGEENEQMN